MSGAPNFDLYSKIKSTIGKGEKRIPKPRKPKTEAAAEQPVEEKKGAIPNAAMLNLLKRLPDWGDATRKIIVGTNYETFPIAGDLPRLLKHLAIVQIEGDDIHSLFPQDKIIANKTEQITIGENTGNNVKAGDCLKLIEKAANVFISEESGSKLASEWNAVMDNGEDLSVQKTFLMQILKKVFVEQCSSGESPVILFLKAINQKIIAPSTMRIKCQCGNLFFKDANPMVWEIAVIINGDKPIISHYRRQEATSKNPSDYFRFVWELRIVFNKELTTLQELSMGITDIEFNEDTSDSVRDRVTSALQSLMLPDCFVGDIDD